MKIYIAADHAGYEMKEKLIPFLRTADYTVVDLGPKHFEREDDYPEMIAPVAREVAKDPEARGIVCGGSGTGEAIVANRFKGVRCALFYGGSNEILRLSREHNDANVLSLGARFLNEDLAKQAVKLWLETKFTDQERHMRRIANIDVEADK